MHFFEITDHEFARHLADYLPKEAFKDSHYLLLRIPSLTQTLLVTSIDRLGELMDGLCIGRQCRRITKKHMIEIRRLAGSSSIQTIVGNIGMWQEMHGEER